MIKYKVAFTIPAETLFSMISKFLPVDDLHVEEIVEQPEPRKIIPKAIAEQLVAEHPKLKKQRKKYIAFKHSSGKSLRTFILEYMHQNQKVTWSELSAVAAGLGFKKTSINNAISRLMDDNAIERIGSGKYKITEKVSN